MQRQTVQDIGAPQGLEKVELVSTRVALQVNVTAVQGTTPLTYLTGVACVSTITCPTKASASEGDFVKFTDGSGLEWLLALDKTGSGIDNDGPIFSAVPVARRAIADISSATSAAEVATTSVAALQALTDIALSILVVDVGDGTITLTRQVRNPCAASVVKNIDESAGGSISVVQTTAGVASAYNITNDTITKASHGLFNGQKVALSGTGLPDGTSATNYYAVVIDANTIGLATSYALALAGTKVDLTSQGTGGQTHTLTPASLAGGTAVVQVSNIDQPAEADWVSISATSQNVTATGSLLFDVDSAAKFARIYCSVTGGGYSVKQTVNTKNERGIL